jgi:hypothetical protein
MQKQAAHGLTFLAGYRWSKCMDESEGAFFDTDAYSTPNPHNDYGPCSFNVTGQFKGFFVWDLPQARTGSTIANHVLSHCQVNGILMLQDGEPFSLLSGVDNSTSGIGLDRADRIGNPALPHRSHAQEAAEFSTPLHSEKMRRELSAIHHAIIFQDRYMKISTSP